MRRLLIVACLAAAACGGDSPAAPSILPAQLVSRGHLTFESCFSFGCSYYGEAINTGSGCATNVRGVLRLFSEQDALVASNAWSYRERVRPNEVFIYGGCCVGQAFSYETTISWDNVSCR